MVCGVNSSYRSGVGIHEGVYLPLATTRQPFPCTYEDRLARLIFVYNTDEYRVGPVGQAAMGPCAPLLSMYAPDTRFTLILIKIMYIV